MYAGVSETVMKEGGVGELEAEKHKAHGDHTVRKVIELAPKDFYWRSLSEALI